MLKGVGVLSVDQVSVGVVSVGVMYLHLQNTVYQLCNCLMGEEGVRVIQLMT